MLVHPAKVDQPRRRHCHYRYIGAWSNRKGRKFYSFERQLAHDSRVDHIDIAADLFWTVGCPPPPGMK